MVGRIRIALCVLIVACSDEATGPKATNIVLNFETVTLQQLDSAQIVPSFVDAKGTLIAGIPTTFTSSDPAVASVSNVGVVRSLGPAGSATITVRGAGLSKTVAVTVQSVATKLVVTPNPGVMPQKGTLQLNPRLLDRVDAPISGAAFAYESANPIIATVSETGLVTSVGPAGSVGITIRSSTFALTVQIAVTQVPTKIQIQAPSPLRLGTTRSIKVGVVVLDAVDAPISGHALRYTSLDPAIVSVAADGTITSIGPLGTATVRVEALGTPLSATLQIVVVSATSPLGNVTDSVTVSGGYAVALTANQAIVVGPFGTPASLIDLQSKTAAALPGALASYGVAVSRDQRHAYLTTTNRTLRRVELATGTFQDLPLNALGYGLAVSRNGLFAVVGTDSDELIVVNLSTFTISDRFSAAPGLHVTIDPLDQFAYVSWDGAVREINLSARSVAREFPVIRGQATAVSGDGRTLYVGTENAAVMSVDLTTGALSVFKQMPDCGSWGIGATPDDRYLYLACSGQGRIDVLDIQSRQVVRQYQGLGEPRRVAVSEGGAVVVVATYRALMIFR